MIAPSVSLTTALQALVYAAGKAMQAAGLKPHPVIPLIASQAASHVQARTSNFHCLLLEPLAPAAVPSKLFQPEPDCCRLRVLSQSVPHAVLHTLTSS